MPPNTEKGMRNLEKVREKLRKLVNGKACIDVGELLYLLNEGIVELGGKDAELYPYETKTRYFEER